MEQGNERVAPRKLSEDLEGMLSRLSEGPMTLGEVEAHLQGRGVALFIMLLAVPFIVPNIPGLSTPFGMAIVLMGLRVMIGSKGSLPPFVLRRSIGAQQLRSLFKGLLWVALKIEHLVRPRMHFLQRWPGMINLIGFGIASAGFFLFLPLPIPLTNTLPAISILFLAAGMMERDGVLVLLGYLFGLLSWGYLLAAVLLGKAGVERVLNWCGWM